MDTRGIIFNFTLPDSSELEIEITPKLSADQTHVVPERGYKFTYFSDDTIKDADGALLEDNTAQLPVIDGQTIEYRVRVGASDGRQTRRTVHLEAGADITFAEMLNLSAEATETIDNLFRSRAVRFDIAQTLTDDQKQQARDNIGAGEGGGETATVESIGALINSATAKTTPVDADMVGLMDSAASNVLKKLSWANIKATLKSYFDTLYGNVTGAASSTDNGIVLFDGTTGKAIKISGVTIDPTTKRLTGLKRLISPDNSGLYVDFDPVAGVSFYFEAGHYVQISYGASYYDNGQHVFYIAGAEKVRITSNGLELRDGSTWKQIKLAEAVDSKKVLYIDE